MTNRHPRGPAFAAALALAVLAGAVVLTPAQTARPGDPAAQEPPPAPTLWHRVSSGAKDLFRPKPADPAREAVRQALEPLGVAAWHQAGHRGKGVKVAILDSGFRGYRAALGKVLPAAVVARSFRKDGLLEARDSQHGILCGEVVHHLAPDAELILANWEPETPASFLDAVRWACQQGAHVISCSVIMPSWSDGDGGGPTHQALRQALGSTLFFASAGNTAQRHWSGTLTPGKDGWHQWAKGKADNAIRPYSHERVSVELTSAKGRYEVVVVDAVTHDEVCRARTRPEDGSAVARFEAKDDRRYAVRVRAVENSAAGRFHLTVLGGRLQYAQGRDSIPFPGDGGEVIAVGAVDAKGRRMTYSSCGPGAGGGKPDLVAAVPVPTVWRPEQAFAGTSAAAPQAAGVAALVRGRWPVWTGGQVREALRQAAGGAKGKHCPETGYGMLRLPEVRR